MALKDSSGRITIDEYAAQQDITRLQQAIQHLENSKKAIENILNQAAAEQGQTASAILEKATELQKQINAMIGRLNDTSAFISRTVAHYQEVDRLVKEAIQNAASVMPSPSRPSAPTQVTPIPTGFKPATSKPSSSNNTKKKKDADDFVEDVVDSVTNIFKKLF